MSFTAADMDELERFCDGRTVVPLIEAAQGAEYEIAMRHDVDHDLDKAIRFAKWEYQRGIRSTYFLLHTAAYYMSWNALITGALHLRSMGHEIGFHHDVMGEAVRRGHREEMAFDLACDIMDSEIGKLRNEGFDIKGVAAHGSGSADNVAFIERATPERFGLTYEAYVLMRGLNYISDNHGYWRSERVHIPGKPAHILIHPMHWPV